MKKLIALITLTAMQATPAMAWIGGPWSNGTYDGHVDGLFGGMMTMSNGSGIFRFTNTETAQLGVFNSSMIYYKGITFLGSCQANIDFDAKKVFGMTNGSAFNRSPAVAQQRSGPLVDNSTSGTPQTVTVPVPLSPIINGTTVTNRGTIAVTAGTGPVGIANTSWQGKITRSAPNWRFQAKGEASFVGDQAVTFNVTVREDPPIVDQELAAGGRLLIPGNIRGVDIDTGGNDPFPTPRNRVRVKVFGSRLSYNVNASVGGQNGGLDGTGGGGFTF